MPSMDGMVTGVINCQTSAWSKWYDCSASCDGGVQLRTREILVRPTDDGSPCPPLTDRRPCNAEPCPSSCAVSDWADWSDCDPPCGVGLQTAARNITRLALPSGKPCPTLTQTRRCTGSPCDSACVLSAWLPWDACSAECGGGKSNRTKKVLASASKILADCEAAKPVESQDCNTAVCSYDCSVSNWEAWSRCEGGCAGSRTRKRTIFQDPAGNGLACPPTFELLACQSGLCLIPNPTIATSGAAPAGGSIAPPNASAPAIVLQTTAAASAAGALRVPLGAIAAVTAACIGIIAASCAATCAKIV
jgi:hypothetical protein